MKQIESQSSVALMLKSHFENDWQGVKFAPLAELVETDEVTEGPIWVVIGKKRQEEICFILEAVSRHAYVCPVKFPWRNVVPEKGRKKVLVNDCGRTGKITIHKGEVAIIWE